MSDWEGAERRAIQTHVINWVDERFYAHTDKIDKILNDHTRDEMERYQEIINKIERNNVESQSRHDTLLSAFKDLHDSVTEAFVFDDKGRPDFHGHAAAHKSLMEDRKDQKEFLTYIKRVVTGAVAIALTMWLGALIWQGILVGPK